MKDTTRKTEPLSDHSDMRLVATTPEDVLIDRHDLVQLDPDHPGFRDLSYRARRNQIAGLAMSYESGGTIPDAPYTQDEHRLWNTVLDALESKHEAFACAEYLDCLRKLDLPRDRIPQLREVSEKVKAISGFCLEPVAGLVQPRVFLESLANGVFLCTQYIRHHSTPLYTPEPDVVHELLGHAVTLASERLAELNRLVGDLVKRARDRAAMEQIARIYWYTLEFGVVMEQGSVKAYGTGLLSSAGELEAMQNAEIRPFNLDEAARLEYDPTRFQPVLFCADSFEAMYDQLHEYLLGL